MRSNTRRRGVKESRAGFAWYRQVDDLRTHAVVSRGQPVRIERYITLITLGLGDDVGLAERDRITSAM